MRLMESRKVVTAQYLAVRHRASVRTIYRDMRTFDKSRISVLAAYGKDYSIVEGYHLPPVPFSQE